MGPATQRDHLSDLSKTVASYLNIMGASADCLEQAYPDVGRVYSQRIHRLRSRVSFHATTEAIVESAQTLETELKDFAKATNGVLTQRSAELTSGVLALGDIIDDLIQRQEFFGYRLRLLAEQVENAGAAAHATGLRGLVEQMGEEASSTVSRMREQMMELDQRLAGTTGTDPVTGLINRRELDRQIEAHTLHGSTYTLLLFELSGPMSDQVLKMAAARLATRFRHPEWIARWSANEFAVLFLGGPEAAQARADEVAAFIQGRYTLENGETVLMDASACVLEPALSAV